MTFSPPLCVAPITKSAPDVAAAVVILYGLVVSYAKLSQSASKADDVATPENSHATINK